ncbi:hydrolase [Lichenicola cladoniae]|uniref:Hydrolase n=1 Tax=Lichenicola cladoniae TaxID=1484109 RepID=A0A6M8HQ48_9PROT|nr:hydrolase [Lichenicola cladoniae]NPD68010.1 hydrolase [Acetobacteraceae bacterium]QKE90593.1 hydrolase [Lichenicola cladoniae]
MLSLDPTSTALVLIDLQNGIVGMPLAPRTGEQTLAAGKALAIRFRDAGATVILVRVAFAADFSDAPPGKVDRAMQIPETGLPPDWSTLADGLQQPGDIVVTKRHWGAFTGTELDTVLRRRSISTVVLGGIATNFGVESTVRHAWEHGYHVVVAEDACSSVSAELHAMTIGHVLPRLSRVIHAADLDLIGA